MMHPQEYCKLNGVNDPIDATVNSTMITNLGTLITLVKNAGKYLH